MHKREPCKLGVKNSQQKRKLPLLSKSHRVYQKGDCLVCITCRGYETETPGNTVCPLWIKPSRMPEGSKSSGFSQLVVILHQNKVFLTC